jgi:hypothetical protein
MHGYTTRKTTAVETQNAVGMVKINQLPCALLTRKALVQPANIIQMLAMAIHNKKFMWMYFASLRVIDR